MAGRRAAARLQRTVNFLKGPRNPPEHLLSNAQPQRVRKSLDPVAFNDTIPVLLTFKKMIAGIPIFFIIVSVSSDPLSVITNRSSHPSRSWIYPPSLPDINDDDHYDMEDWRLEHIQSANIVVDVPSRPPRSLLSHNSNPTDIYRLRLLHIRAHSLIDPNSRFHRITS
ncbi:hypothetical protein L208DRAFT_1405361 [Tricholoma matsutake]|nr:hypothetical protein L208DRAFT_1405361 [Tricholoma matsutake 945]